MEIVSWDGHTQINDGENYTSVLTGRPLLWDAAAQIVDRNDARPGVSNISYEAMRVELGIAIEGADVNALRAQLGQWFNYRDKQSRPLVISDKDGGRPRFLMCVCEGLRPRALTEGRYIWIASLVIDGFGDPDGRWRLLPIAEDNWAITATGQTKVIDNSGDDIAYPVLIIEPTAAKTGGYAYKRWCPVIWPQDVGISNYPVDLTDGGFDTDALVTASKMRSDGNDLRVQVNGNEVDRWINGINTISTQVWINMSFQPRARATLVNAIDDEATVLTLDLESDELPGDSGKDWFDAFPSSGVVLINSEAFTYTGKTASLGRLTGVRRAQRGTAAADHAAGAVVHWIQHDVYILYGNATAAAPTVPNTYKPMFDLDSINEAWSYSQFYDSSNPNRPGRWSQLGEAAIFYGGNQGTFANPYVELGLSRIAFMEDISAWYTFNPCGITNANFQDGEKFTRDSEWMAWQVGIDSSPNGSAWTSQAEVDQPTVDDEWQAWDEDLPMPEGTIYVRLRHWSIMGEQAQAWVEATDVILTLDDDNTPVASIGSEQGNYQLNALITNQTTGDAIQVTYTMGTGQEFEVNTDNKTLTDLVDDSSQFQALTVIGELRRDWLPLVLGENTLRFDDTGTNGVTVTVQWYERHFD